MKKEMSSFSTKSRRQRAILSCNDCRRRKLKCDRLKPCNRCIQGGIADSCAYGPNAHLRTSDDAEEQPSKRLRVDPTRDSEAFETKSDVCHTLSHVNSHITLAQPAYRSEPKDAVEFLTQSPNLKAVDSQGAMMGLLKGRGYATFFYGSSSAMSIIALFPELRKFMKEVYSTSTARRLSQDMKRFEDQARSIQPLHRVLRVTTLRSLLPDRSTVDILVHKYLETFEKTLRILHVPTFQKTYATYWDGNHQIDTDMDAIVLMILACTNCTATHDSPRYSHNGSSFHTSAAVWIRACEVWLKRQSNKHKSLANFQVRCLRLLALATTSLKAKEYYHEVQTHLAIMRSHGMHRDPSICGSRCSTFEGEMRRRLWATSMELELQASVDKGIPSMLSNLDYDCAPPRNINDVDLTIELEGLPPCQNDSVFTDTSFLHCSLQHLDLRVRLCSLANNIRRTPDNEALLEVEATIRQRLNSLPQWPEPESFSVQVLLKLHLQQYIIVLFASKALRMETGTEPGSRYFAVAALETAESTIDLHLSVLERSNYALCLTRIDYFRAALFICHLTYSVFERQDKILTRFTKLAFEATMSKAIQIQEERAMRPGRGTEYLWYLSAATSLVGLTIEPSQADKMKRQAIDRIAKLLYKQLSLQDEPSAESLASEILLESTPNAGMNLDTATNTAIQEPPPAQSFDQAGLGVNDFGLGDSSSNWSFDDYWFFNDVLGLDLNTDLQPALY